MSVGVKTSESVGAYFVENEVLVILTDVKTQFLMKFELSNYNEGIFQDKVIKKITVCILLFANMKK